MSKKKSLCVFCGASNNVAQKYLDEGKKLGQMIAERNMHMVFGAGDCGVMGATAAGALKHGGTVTGVFPRVLDGLEKEHSALTETIIVDTMHIRKMTMFEKSDAFVILPGGFGTMDETFEVITWKQLHTHDKPVVLYNFDGYWDNWIKMTDEFIDLGFASQRTKTLYDVVDTLEGIFEKI